jgi:hypothetical protein
MTDDHADAVALHRWAVIAQAANPGSARRSETRWCAPPPAGPRPTFGREANAMTEDTRVSLA